MDTFNQYPSLLDCPQCLVWGTHLSDSLDFTLQGRAWNRDVSRNAFLILFLYTYGASLRATESNQTQECYANETYFLGASNCIRYKINALPSKCHHNKQFRQLLHVLNVGTSTHWNKRTFLDFFRNWTSTVTPVNKFDFFHNLCLIHR